jgi:site-specific DNA-methyltransferase (adenine-specific)
MKSRDGASAVPREVQFYEAWAREHLREWVRVLKPTGAAWFTCDWRGAMAFDLAAHKLRIKSPDVGVWDRGGLGMGHILRKTWEAFVVVPMLGFERKATDVPDLWRVEWTIAQRGNEHAAEKPEALFRKAVRLVSDPDAVILDPFAGSGTSGPAALAEGRRVILIERDEEYRDICERRCAASATGTNWRKPEQGALGGIL